MKIVKIKADYWIEMDDCDPCGPYTKEMAEETLRGLGRFYKYKDTPGFITCDSRTNTPSNDSSVAD
jgi:hypothetical protein